MFCYFSPSSPGIPMSVQWIHLAVAHYQSGRDQIAIRYNLLTLSLSHRNETQPSWWRTIGPPPPHQHHSCPITSHAHPIVESWTTFITSVLTSFTVNIISVYLVANIMFHVLNGEYSLLTVVLSHHEIHSFNTHLHKLITPVYPDLVSIVSHITIELQ